MWHRVTLVSLEQSAKEEIGKTLGRALEQSEDGLYAFISNEDLKKLDPALLHKLKSTGILSDKGFCRVLPAVENSILKGEKEVFVLQDGSRMVPFETVNAMKPDEILKIRAKDMHGLAMIGLVLLAFLIVSFGLSYVETYVLELIGQKIMQD